MLSIAHCLNPSGYVGSFQVFGYKRSYGDIADVTSGNMSIAVRGKDVTNRSFEDQRGAHRHQETQPFRVQPD